MDIQIFLIVILTILTISLVSVCVYVVLILKEFRNTLRKANHTLDSVNGIKESLLNTSTILGLVTGVFETIKSIRSVRTIADYEDEEE